MGSSVSTPLINSLAYYITYNYFYNSTYPIDTKVDNLTDIKLENDEDFVHINTKDNR